MASQPQSGRGRAQPALCSAREQLSSEQWSTLQLQRARRCQSLSKGEQVAMIQPTCWPSELAVQSQHCRRRVRSNGCHRRLQTCLRHIVAHAASADLSAAHCRMSALSSPSTSAAEAPPAANGSSTAGWSEAVRAVAKALDPAQPQLQRNLDTLHATLEANQARLQYCIVEGVIWPIHAENVPRHVLGMHCYTSAERLTAQGTVNCSFRCSIIRSIHLIPGERSILSK